MNPNDQRVDSIRATRSELENHLIDELRAGKIGRREFVRRGAVVGMSVPLLSFIATACGVSRQDLEAKDKAQTKKAQPGGALRVGQQQPPGALDPVTVNSQAGLTILGQTGEYLIWSDRELNPEPRLAESWKPNEDGSVWTFKLRKGVKFHDGKTMDAEDVATTFDRLADPDNGSNALSAFTGVLSKGNTKAVDATTVEFQLDAPNGNFPYLTSSDNYNTIILPKDYDGDWEKTFIGTGPWKLERFEQGVGITLVPNQDYWAPGRRALTERQEIVFYTNEQSLVLGLPGQRGGRGGAVLGLGRQGAAHRRLGDHHGAGLRRAPPGPPAKRQGAVQGQARAPGHGPADRPARPGGRPAGHEGRLRQRQPLRPDLPLDREGRSSASRTWPRPRSCWPRPARRAASACRCPAGRASRCPTSPSSSSRTCAQAGIRINLNITNQATYFGEATYGNSPWLDSTMGITEYGHRGVPNVVLGAPLNSKGTWNGAHFRNKRYDSLVEDYVGAVDLDEQRRSSKQIQELLLDEVPIMFTYFYYFLSGAKDYVAGVETNAMGHTDVSRAGLT